MYLTIYDIQKLLLLQELTDNDFAITDTNTGPIKITNIPTINKELSSSNEYKLLSNEVSPAQISVSGLTASWKHVIL